MALGYFRNFSNNRFEASVEAYYKWMDRIIDFKLGEQANILFSNNLETEILEGKGWAYGTEFLLRKNTGSTTGWIGYTLSRTMRQIPGINDNQPYPARYDRIHDLSVVLSQEISPRLTVSGTFVYSTGAAVSLPVGKAEWVGLLCLCMTITNAMLSACLLIIVWIFRLHLRIKKGPGSGGKVAGLLRYIMLMPARIPFPLRLNRYIMEIRM